MTLRFTLISFCVLCLLGCNSKKNLQKTSETTNTTEMETPSTFELSTFTKLFHADLKKQALETNGKLPESFIKRYQLAKMDGQYFAKGFIQTTVEWNPQALTDLGIKLGASSGKIKTISIPVRQFDAFLGLSGISYFQLNETVNPKN